MGEAGPTLSLSGFLLHADLVVQGVVALLVAASVVCWAIMIEKVIRLRHLRRGIRDVEALARTAVAPAHPEGLVGAILAASDEEMREAAGPDLRARIEAAMRGVLSAEMRRHEAGLSVLATVASTAPFAGLFGTVWGIMHSFSAIGASSDTSLAAVAPGVAEALFATAIGLATAIPAVVGYNQIRAAFTRCSHRFTAGAAVVARRRARAPAEAGRAL